MAQEPDPTFLLSSQSKLHHLLPVLSLWHPGTFQKRSESLCQIFDTRLRVHLSSQSLYPFCPIRMTFSSSPYFFLIHLIPCSCGSTMSGQRWQEERMVAFSVDILSAGRPSFCHAAMSASSVSMVSGSRSGVTGMGTLNDKWDRTNPQFRLWKRLHCVTKPLNGNTNNPNLCNMIHIRHASIKERSIYIFKTSLAMLLNLKRLEKHNLKFFQI